MRWQCEGAQMSQQINLYEARLRPVREWATGRRLVIAGTCALVLCIAGVLAVRGLASEREQALAQAQAALKAEQEQLAQLTSQLAERKLPPALQGELEQARALLGARREVLGVLDSGALGSTQGFAPVFVGFSRLASADLWLTGFSVSHGGADIEIRGRMFDAARLPAYVQRLSAEPAFQGRRFAALTLQRQTPEAEATAGSAAVPVPTGAATVPVATGPRFVDFVLRSERGGAETKEGAAP